MPSVLSASASTLRLPSALAPAGGCWCCACEYSRNKTKEGCDRCWTNPKVQDWIDQWADPNSSSRNPTWGAEQTTEHGLERDFACPPVSMPPCPGFLQKRDRRVAKSGS